MHRRPRRISPHPRYEQPRLRRRPSGASGGKRLSAEEIRRARRSHDQEAAPPTPPSESQVEAVPQPASGPPPLPSSRVPQRLTAADLRRARETPGARVPVRPLRPTQQRGRPAARPTATAAVPPKRRRSRKRMVLIGFPLLLLLIAGVVVGDIAWRARNAYGKIFVPPPPSHVYVPNPQGTPVLVPNAKPTPMPTAQQIADWSGKGRINLVLLGADTSVDRRKEGEVPLSDTIIIVSINPVTKQVGMMSIPRDTLVTIPGVGQDKINAAYSDGSLSNITGPGLVMDTLQYNWGIHIDYFAVVDFNGFQKIVDTLGGVTLDVPAPIKDDSYPAEDSNYTRVLFQTGLQHMDGQTALHYVRTRHDDNDFARGDRQQQLLEALRQQATAMNLITKGPTLIDELGDTVRTDLPPSKLLELAKLGTEIKSSDIHSYSLLPALTEQWDPSDPASVYYLIPDKAKVEQILNQMMPPPPASTPTPATAQSTTPTVRPVERPDLQGRILVENATHVDKLAARSAAQLKGQGFLNVQVAQAPDTGQHPTSEIISYSDNLATARLVAQTLGLPTSAVTQGNPAQSNGYEVVAILGNDAPIPSG